jgi:hypothetical protein
LLLPSVITGLDPAIQGRQGLDPRVRPAAGPRMTVKMAQDLAKTPRPNLAEIMN